jgi:amidase
VTIVSLDPFAPATAMLRALRGRRVSAVELLDLHLRHIERHNPTLNALVTPDFEAARRAAGAADAARAGGEERPLLGLPLTVKDSIDVAGLRGTAGMPAFADRRPVADAPVVARARAAGAVIMGKTNVPPRTADWQAANPVSGRTVNPWDHTRTPGGSTGGGAAALAAGLTPLELGSDMAGSIRVPAAFCGVYGHRPSETAVPRAGHFPGAPLPNPATRLGVLGPLARSADDLALAFDVLAGPAAGEDVAWRLSVPPARHGRLADYRVAILPPVDWLPLDDEIATALEALAADLGRRGARVGRAQPDRFGDLRHHDALYRSLAAVTSAAMPPAESGGRPPEAGAAAFVRWFDEREDYRASYRAFFAEWDVLLAPVTCTLPFAHTETPLEERTIRVNGQVIPCRLMSVYPALATLSGQPATAFPSGLSRACLPIGLQAIGPYLEDRTPLRFAALVAEERGGFRRPPGYAAA